LWTSGRLIVIFAIPASSPVDSSYLMSAYSAADCQVVVLTAAETTVSGVNDWLQRAARWRPDRVALTGAGAEVT
jgi:hypothetical protein